MKVSLKGTETQEAEVLPEHKEEIVADQPTSEDRIRELELTNARLEGENKARSSTPAAPSGPDQKQIKAQVWADMNVLDDDQFKARWGNEKWKTSAALLEQDFQNSDTKNRQEIATLRAEQRLAAKYKEDFYDLKPEIDEVLSLASPDVRQDPDKLAKLMETAYFASKGRYQGAPGAKTKPKGENMDRKKITGGFDKPSYSPAPQNREDVVDPDEIAPEYQQLARAFGIKSEKERKELVASNIIPVDLGNGKIYNGKEVVDRPGIQVAA